MNILALETSGRRGSVAALTASDGDARLLDEAWLPDTARSAQTLAPAIQELLLRVNWQPSQVELIAVTTGPGSFTGLRIGVTTAKTFAYATGAKVISVDTLHVLAEQAGRKLGPLWAVLDAHRNELFAAKFEWSPDGILHPIVDSHVVGRDAWLIMLASGDSVTGPVLDSLLNLLPSGIVVVDRAQWQPRAAVVGKIGCEAHRGGQTNDLWQLVPRYFRPSAAEEKWAAQQHDPTK